MSIVIKLLIIQSDITYLQVVGSMMVVIRLLIILTKKDEELKAPYRASTTAIRNYITTRDIVPTLAILLLWLPSTYKYHLTSALNRIL